MKRRLLAVPLAALLLGASGAAALADDREATTLAAAVPSEARLGQTVELRARLLDSSGAPVAKALVVFSASLSFLSDEGEVVLADARTGADGIATARVAVRTEGGLDVTAAFRGDERYTPSSAAGRIVVSGDVQLFSERAGVVLPGLNRAPLAGGASAGLTSGLAGLWPALSGWPVALVLMIIWSLYGSVVVLVFRIVRDAKAGTT